MVEILGWLESSNALFQADWSEEHRKGRSCSHITKRYPSTHIISMKKECFKCVTNIYVFSCLGWSSANLVFPATEKSIMSIIMGSSRRSEIGLLKNSWFSTLVGNNYTASTNSVELSVNSFKNTTDKGCLKACRSLQKRLAIAFKNSFHLQSNVLPSKSIYTVVWYLP